jgi:outer membrane protein assembly factor BamD
MGISAWRRAPSGVRVFLRFLTLASLVAVAGCSALDSLFGDKAGEPTTDALEPARPAGELYNQGLAFMAEGEFKRAVESFEEVDRQHPYSEWAQKAHLMMVFAHYRQGSYQDAVQAGNRYLTLYPSSDDAAYAQYLVGESYFRQIPDVTRDQETAGRALSAMQEIVNKYPDSEYAVDAQNKINVTRDQLAGKEMQVGRYYLERREYVAAVNRFRSVVTEYQTTRHVEEALMRLTEAYLSMGLASEAQTAAAVLGHNFPTSQWYVDALALLQSGGLDPSENEGSWISRALRGTLA